MSFLSTLKDSAASPKAAFLQFITTKDPDDYSTFAFVEDDDDIEFYQHVLVSFDPIAYFGCGGKGGVFEVYQYLEGRGRS